MHSNEICIFDFLSITTTTCPVLVLVVLEPSQQCARRSIGAPSSSTMGLRPTGCTLRRTSECCCPGGSCTTRKRLGHDDVVHTTEKRTAWKSSASCRCSSASGDEGCTYICHVYPAARDLEAGTREARAQHWVSASDAAGPGLSAAAAASSDGSGRCESGGGEQVWRLRFGERNVRPRWMRVRLQVDREDRQL